MHELSLAQEILRTVDGAARENTLSRVTQIGVVVGKMSAVLPDALSFSFEAIKDQVPCWAPGLFGGTRLEIEERDVEAKCKACGHLFALGPDLNCPKCGAAALELAGGTELYIDSFDGE